MAVQREQPLEGCHTLGRRMAAAAMRREGVGYSAARHRRGAANVSIGIPVFNGERHIRRALDSLLGQSYEEFELIISDNASTDSTWQILEDYAAKDGRITIHRQPQNIGASSNFRFVLEGASGVYFMWAAHDDWWSPGFIAAMVAELETHPDAAVCMSGVERIRDGGESIDIVRYSGKRDPNVMTSPQLALRLAAGKPYHLYIYGLYRREFLLRAFQGFPRVAGGDRLFVCGVALATRFRYVDQVLYFRQMSQMTIARRYADEELGRLWKDPFAGLKLVLLAGPYLLRMNLIPLRRKVWVPLIVLRLARWRAVRSLRQRAGDVLRKAGLHLAAEKILRRMSRRPG